MKFTKLKIAVSILALGATALTAFSQAVPLSGSFTVTTVTLPTGLTLSAGTSTNLASGWTNTATTITTNTTYGWNGSVLATNTTYTTNTGGLTYARMNVQFQKDCYIVVTEAADIGTNTYAFAPELDSGTIDTNNVFTMTLRHAAIGTAYNSTNVPAAWIGGAGGIRLLYQSWIAPSGVMSNSVIKYGRIQGAK